MNIFSSIKILFFSDICICCGRKLLSSEHSLCVNCIVEAPLTREWKDKENDTFIKICDRTLIENGCAFLEYHKGSNYSKMIHNMKFKYERKALFDVGSFMGNKLNAEAHWIKDIDVIIPVPIHTFRRLKRGYNQSELLSRGLNTSFNKEIDVKSVIRHKNIKAQVKTANSEQRWENVVSIFKVLNPENLENKHILIVDDVITTGATIISLINTIKDSVKNVKISVLTLSSTRRK